MCLQTWHRKLSSDHSHGDAAYLPEWGTHMHSYECLKGHDMMTFPPDIKNGQETDE